MKLVGRQVEGGVINQRTVAPRTQDTAIIVYDISLPKEFYAERDVLALQNSLETALRQGHEQLALGKLGIVFDYIHRSRIMRTDDASLEEVML